MQAITIGIIGNGVVGKATARVWMEYAKDVRVWDIDETRRTHALGETVFSDLVFVCLPTPAAPDGSGELDLGAIHKFFNRLGTGTQLLQQNFVIRSTVPVGTTRRLQYDFKIPNIVHNPEFLTARCAVQDALNPAQIVLGTPRPGAVLWSGGNKAAEALLLHCSIRFPGRPILPVSSNESEFIELALNSLFAAKIALFNELRAYAEADDMLWPRVLEGILGDGRVGISHTQVPGPDGKPGFGGSCLPKDLAQMVRQIAASGGSPVVLDAVERRNKNIDRAEYVPF